MLSVLLSWAVVFTISYLLGKTVINHIYTKNIMIMGTIDLYLVTGLLLCNIYVQFFSLFFKISVLAFLLLLLVALSCLIIISRLKSNIKNNYFTKPNMFVLIIFLVCFVLVLIWTVCRPEHYDTMLYHAQAIHWIEEFGIVKGLGNFHNRFAYNSAFMPLQALFSFKWLMGQSLHTLNGFICVVFTGYAIFTMQILKSGKLLMSDLFKLAIILYVFLNREYISSPNSDIYAMLMVIYINAKWSELIEKKVVEAMPWAYLSILSVYAITIKLSVAMTILLVLFPAFYLIKEKQWKVILYNMLGGIAVAFPFLARNIIISGYILYPYYNIDLFYPDWKMPASVLHYDSKEIMVWGRGLQDVGLYNQNIFEWFPHWFNVQGIGDQILIIAGLTGTAYLIAVLVYLILKKSNFSIGILVVASLFELMVWLFTAPLLRYGIVFLMIPVCISLPLIVNRYKYSFNRLLAVLFLMIIGFVIIKNPYLRNIPIYVQEDYEQKPSIEVDFQGYPVWIPESDDRVGYYNFPNTPNAGNLKYIELRGKGFAEGFRVKKECKSLNLNAYGNVY